MKQKAEDKKVKPEDATTDEKINDVTSQPPQEPVKENPADIKNLAGKIVELGSGATIWRSNSGNIELNMFTGKVSATVPKNLTEFELGEISRGLQYGRLKIAEKMTTKEPINTRAINMDTLHSINIFLDEKKISAFEQNVKRTSSATFLSLCLSVEEDDRNRPEYKKIIAERLKILS